MELNLVEIWQSMGLPVRGVVIVLTIQAIACFAVVMDRIVLLALSAKRARKFAEEVEPLLQSADYAKVLECSRSAKANHLSGYLEVGLAMFTKRRTAGDELGRAAELARRALERKGDMLSRDLNKGMNTLASTGSTAPFVGLLGTVLGIIHAFKLIASSGSGGIGTIGSAIGESLVVTGYGLCIAIPSVLVFNWLSSKITDYESGLINAGSELVDRLEMQDGHAEPASSSAAAGEAHAGARAVVATN